MPIDDDEFDAAAFTEAIEERLLGGRPTLSTNQLAEKAGIPTEYGHQLWRSMGFAISDNDDEPLLTELDLSAMQRVKDAVDQGIVTFDEVVSLARLSGRVFAQLAESEGDGLVEIALAKSDTGDPREIVDELATEMLPLLEAMNFYVWRRQLFAYASRTLARLERAGASAEGIGSTTGTVGFADISGFTALSRQTSEADLNDLLERFESVVTEVIGSHTGRVVKLIGDAVLFVAPDAVIGAHIAVDLVETWPDDQPALRAGLATGPILRRQGDVFGPTVNIASRITAIAKPGQIRIDRGAREVLAESSDFTLRSHKPRTVRGYHHLKSWSLKPRQPS